MKGWLDNFGKANNANDSKVSMSEDFVGLGYNTEGRNYSPAWGGQFQIGGKLNPVSPTQQIQQAVEPTPTVPYLQTKDPAEFYKSWIQNPEYERRLKATGYSDVPNRWSADKLSEIESVKKERLGLLENIQPIEYDPSKRSEAIIDYYDGSTINVNPSDYKTFSKQSVEAHEIAHVATPQSTMGGNEFGIFMGSMLPSKKPVVSGVQGSKEREASKEAVGDFEHLQKPWEAKADLDALRFMMYDKGIYDITKGKKFTETDFEKVKQSFGKERVFKRFTDKMGKENFVKLMNTIALADDQEEAPIAMGGMSIPGSVGFSYARVAGAAPSKGKYAKKTMASAQTGKNNIKKDATNIDTGIANKIAGLELQQNPEYQYFKYLQSLPQLRQAPGRGEELMRQGLGYADVATDVMQMGNFIPHPTAQAVGKVGNIAGMIVDGLQGADEAYRGNYLNAGINLASVALPMFLGSNTFRRNAMNLRPGDPLYSLTQKAGKPYTIDLNKTDTGYLELFSKVKGMKDKSLMYNRAFLGGLGAETAYDAGLIGPVKKEYGGEIPSAQNGIMSPMLLARNVLNYFYPSEEAAPAVEAAPVEYKKGLTNELLQRQAYKESTFNPAAVSPAGYKGLTQIGEGVLEDYSNKKGGKKLDPFNPEDAVELQKFAMDDLYNASFINKPNQSDSVRIAKTLAAYNWGRGNLSNYLNEQKSKGVDIYDSYDWLNNLPKETSDYVNKILLQEDPSFNKNYKKASTNPKYEEVTSLYDQKMFGGDIPSAQNGQEMRFYQNGLDWKPKSMQEGGDIIYAQEGIRAPYRLPEYQQKFANYDVSKSRPNDPEDSFSGKQKKFIAEEISDPFTTRVLNVLNDIKPLNNIDIYNTIRPIEYPNVSKLPRLAYNYVMGNETEPLKTKDGKPHIAEEFWATALNIPGEKEYLKESQYKPSKSKDPNAKYYTIRDIIDERDLMNLTKNLKPGEKMKMNGLSPILDSEWYSENAKTDNNISFEDLDPLQRFTLERSDDGSYISIYDKYDFDNPALNRVLNSFEIYDRFYIDKEDNKQSKLLPSSPKKKKDGGIIKDNQGYWNSDNWGKPVEIDSNDITMEGVYEPLLGVSDTGDTKLMKPGKNYKFKGKKVTEFPVAQWGEGVPFKEAATPTKNISNPLNLRKELVPYIKPKASFEEQKRIAKLELDKYGYTLDQRKNYIKGKSEKAFKNIVPQGYGDLTRTLDRIERYEKNLGRNPEETLWYGAEDSSTGKPIYYDLPKRDDAFALYLGLPQKNKSFGISEYQPGDSKENKYYYKPNYLDENLKNRLVASYFSNVEDGKNTYIANERGDAFPQKTDSLERAGVPFENPMYAEWMVDNALGDFKMSKGKDEKGHYVSIYDVWDLNPFKQGEGSSSNPAAGALKVFAKMKGVDVGDETEMSNLFGAGKPFEIYDRIYYDPKTKKVIPQKRNGGDLGINQLDAQPMKKLNQLLNFTNNPDKDNWLDKYN